MNLKKKVKEKLEVKRDIISLDDCPVFDLRGRRYENIEHSDCYKCKLRERCANNLNYSTPEEKFFIFILGIIVIVVIIGLFFLRTFLN